MIEAQQLDNAAATKAAIDRFAPLRARARRCLAEPLTPGAAVLPASVMKFGRIARVSSIFSVIG